MGHPFKIGSSSRKGVSKGGLYVGDSLGNQDFNRLVDRMAASKIRPSEWIQRVIKIPNPKLMEQMEGVVSFDECDDMQEGHDPPADFDPAVLKAIADLGVSEDTLENFSIADQPYMNRPYDTFARRALFLCARQVGKSTLDGNKMLAYTCMRPNFRSLYVSPSEAQTKRFSMFRISDPIRFSPDLQVYKGMGVVGKGKHFSDNIFSKRFVNESTMTLSYANLTADRIRGLSADLLVLDEIQDMLYELIPVIRETLFTSPYKMELYSGTPKSTDNTINYFWEERSTKYEWAMRCTKCSTWNITGPENIGLHFLICKKCGGQLYPADVSNAQWVSARSPQWLKETNPKTRFEGFRIPQPISPFADWPDILDKRDNYPTAEFMNEVMGRSHDSADKLLSKVRLLPNCLESHKLSMGEQFIGRGPTFMGVDWGTGEANSYTVVTVSIFIGGHLFYIYFRRYLGHESDLDTMIPDIASTFQKYKCIFAGTDFGGGHDKNYALGKAIGNHRLIKYQYNNASLLYLDHRLNRYMVNRTEVIMRFVYCIYRGDVIRLPRWDDIVDPFMTDLMAVFREMNKDGTRAVINRSPGASDDTLHSMLYCMLAYLAAFPRPDILTPDAPRG